MPPVSPHHVPPETLAAGLEHIRRSPVDDGSLELIVRRPAVDQREVLDVAELDPAEGMIGDTWRTRGSSSTPDGAADRDAQLTLMNYRCAMLVAGSVDRVPLAGDQLYVDLDLSGERLPAGTRLSIGQAVVEITAKPHRGCQKFAARFGATALRFVNVGTSEIYGDVPAPFREDQPVRPISPYAASKYGAECFARVLHQGRGAPIVFLRPFNAYGPAQSTDRVIPEIIVRALRGEPVRMTQGRQTREFNYVADLVDAMVRAAATDGVEGELFNLGCGEDVAVRDVASTVLAMLGNPVEAHFGALPERPTEIWTMRSDSRRAVDRLGWKPQHSLSDGLAKTIAWYRRELADPASPFAVP